MNLDQVLVEADSSSSSDLEILDDTDDVVPDTGTDNTFQETEERVSPLKPYFKVIDIPNGCFDAYEVKVY